MLMGDIYDAAEEPLNWKSAGFDDKDWKRVTLTEDIAENPLTAGLEAEKIATRSVPVLEMESFDGRELIDASGRRVIDFGQNIAGKSVCQAGSLKPLEAENGLSASLM